MKKIPFDLKTWRERHKMKQVELAELLGVCTVSLYKMEKEKHITRLVQWALIAVTENVLKNRLLDKEV